MFAVTFDLTTEIVKNTYSKSVASAYTEVKLIMEKHNFEWIQGSVYANGTDEALKAVHRVMVELKQLQWFCESVRDIRVFQILVWSDFTDDFK